MYPTIIIPTIKSPTELAPMLCDVQGYSEGCEVIATHKQTSAAANRNYGLEKAKSDYIIMIDDDITGFYQWWWRELIEPLKIENVIYVSANLTTKRGDEAIMMFRKEGAVDENGLIDVPRIPTSAIAFVRNSIRFDENFKGSGFEDDDFCAQMSEKYPFGRVVIADKVKLIHTNEEKNQSEYYSENKKYFESKWDDVGLRRERKGKNDWKHKIEALDPKELLEIPDPIVFMENEEQFRLEGFTLDMWDRLFPILEEQVWSMFQLFCLAKKVPEGGKILEIGSGQGGSISTMGLANPTAEFTNIDKFDKYDETSVHGTVKDYAGFTYEQFCENVKPFNLNIKTIRKWSQDASGDVENGYFDMIFVDGNHTYEYCLQDIYDYLPKLKDGGIFAVHDYHPLWPGVIKAVKEVFADDFYVAENSSIAVRGSL